MENKIKIYNSAFALFLKALPSEELYVRYFNNSLDGDDESYDDEGFTLMQDFVTNNMKDGISWSTGIGIIDAIEKIVEEAISNANITSDFEIRVENKTKEPEIFSKAHLKAIGFKLVKDDGKYGEAKDVRTNGMTVIKWNREGHSCTYFGEKLESNISVGIMKDGGTRTAFNGYVFSKEQFELLIKLTM